jgi:DNA (cytosine-5)-methyltransferase 1
MPCPRRKGRTFARWKKSLENLGYTVTTRRTAPATSARRRSASACSSSRAATAAHRGPAVHACAARQPAGAPAQGKPYRTAAECIMWDEPAPSIFERTRELADATKRRIAKGIMRYVVNADQPFIVPLTHQGGDRVEGLDEPFKTITGANRGEKALIVPTLDRHGPRRAPGPAAARAGSGQAAGHHHAGRRQARAGHRLPDRARERQHQRVMPADEPMRTQIGEVKGGHFSVVTAALLAQNNNQRVGVKDGRSVDEPISTITAAGASSRS